MMSGDRYFVGQQLPEFIGRHNATQFDLTDNGAMLIIVLDNPTNSEVWNISQLNEIRLTCFPDALWLTFQFGTLPWMDAPYTPHLSTRSNLMANLDTACSSLAIMLINSVDGRILYLGKGDFDDAFSAGLRVGVMMLLSQEFNREEYDALCKYIINHYNSEEIADRSVVSFSLC